MNTSIARYKLSWLCESTAVDFALSQQAGEVQRHDYRLAPELGSAWAESLSLGGGMTLFHAVHDLQASPRGHMVPLMDVRLVTPEPIFCAQVFLGGLCSHQEQWANAGKDQVEIVAGPGLGTFRHHSDWQAKILGEGGNKVEMFSLVAYDSDLTTLIGADTAEQLITHLGLGPEVATVVKAMPSQISTPLREAMAPHFFGNVRKLYAQSRMLEYLANLIRQVSNAPRPPAKQRRHQTRIHELHEYLLQLEGSLPMLNELAGKFGGPARQLNTEFATEYGQSVYAFVTNMRLEQARQALIETTIPMKVLANRLGYSHANHFIAAFKRKFGYTPGSLRKGAATAPE